MLFYLTKSLIVDKSDSSYYKIKRAVRNLATAAIEGKHIVLGKTEVVDYFFDIFVNSEDDVSLFFNKLKQNLSTVTIPKSITMYVEVVNGFEGHTRKGHCDIEQVDYSHFLDTRCVQATAFLCEDIEYDCQLYKFILNWFIDNKQENININLNNNHGGGDRIGIVLRDCVKQGCVSLCIVDSDISFPGQPKPSYGTAYECMRVRRSALEGLLVLNVHEAENLLPFNFIEMVANSLLPIKRKNSFRKLYDNKVVADEVLRFFDFKIGLKKLEKFFEYPDFIKFAKNVCEADTDFLGEISFNEYYNKKSVNEELYPGVAKRILNFTLDVMNKENLPQPQLMNYQLEEWERLGQVMLNYCCAERIENLLN